MKTLDISTVGVDLVISEVRLSKTVGALKYGFEVIAMVQSLEKFLRLVDEL